MPLNDFVYCRRNKLQMSWPRKKPLTKNITPVLLTTGEEMKSYLVIATVFIVFASCMARASEDWSVLSDAQGFSGVWKPEEKSIPKLLSNAKSYLENLQKSPMTDDCDLQDIKKILKRWDRYRCQIVGYRKDGKK